MEQALYYLMDIWKKEQNHRSVDNLLKFVDKEQNKMKLRIQKTIIIHYQPPRKRYHRR